MSEGGGCSEGLKNCLAGDHPPLSTAHAHRPTHRRRYYIGSDKLGALGWREAVSWEEGLRK